jgi:hypothetical protein
VTKTLTALLLLGLLPACSHLKPTAPAAAATPVAATPPATPAAGTPAAAPAPPVTPAAPATPPPPAAAAKAPAPSAVAAASGKPADAAAPPKRPAPPKPAAPPTPPAAVAAAPPAPAALNLASLEQRLRDTRAIGVFTKLSLKNQVDDLLDQFRALYHGQVAVPLAALRQRYDLLMLKVLSLLQDGDPPLANDIVASREAIWGILRDPAKFATIT